MIQLTCILKVVVSSREILTESIIRYLKSCTPLSIKKFFDWLVCCAPGFLAQFGFRLIITSF